jgi:hypothetical protein
VQFEQVDLGFGAMEEYRLKEFERGFKRMSKGSRVLKDEAWEQR